MRVPVEGDDVLFVRRYPGGGSRAFAVNNWNGIKPSDVEVELNYFSRKNQRNGPPLWLLIGGFGGTSAGADRRS